MSYRIYQGDCFQVLPQIEDKSVQMVLCDPPYGTTPLKWDSLLDFERLWEEYRRVLTKTGVVVLFGQEPFSTFVRMSNIKAYKYDW